jgi:hypothetical protein
MYLKARGKYRQVLIDGRWCPSMWPTSSEEALAEKVRYYFPPTTGLCGKPDHEPGTLYYALTNIAKCCALRDAVDAYAAAKLIGDPINIGEARLQGKDYYWSYQPGAQCGHVGMVSFSGGCYICEQEKKNVVSPRLVALDSGQDWYMPTTPCRNGHLALRRVNNSECIQCTQEQKAMRPPATDPPIYKDPRYADTIISLLGAKAAGMKVFRTGEPCRAGHRGWRYVSTRNCITCMGR